MPQDSLYVILDNGDTFYLPSKTGQGIDTLTGAVNDKNLSNNDFDFSGTVMALILLGVFAVGHLFRKHRNESAHRSELTLPTVSDDAKWLTYHKILSQKNPYYNKLPRQLQHRFLIRLVHFMNGKKFSFMEMQPSEDAMVLISAVAIQITFGLQEFEMYYFRNIYIMRTNYHFGLSTIPFEGHVSSTGIYLSWNNFEKSFADYSDGNNLGLHEMAHALAYVNFTAQEGRDNHFRKRFKEFSKTGRKVFNEMQAGKMNMLGSYAATNYHEFWAVCIENFFERPELLKKELPALYFELVMLLRQDPTSDNLLISSE